MLPNVLAVIILGFRYNIKYGRLTAAEADIIEAARGADIHEKILQFPEGYETQVSSKRLFFKRSIYIQKKKKMLGRRTWSTLERRRETESGHSQNAAEIAYYYPVRRSYKRLGYSD